jgi:hypothetical protein
MNKIFKLVVGVSVSLIIILLGNISVNKFINSVYMFADNKISSNDLIFDMSQMVATITGLTVFMIVIFLTLIYKDE